MEASTEQVLQEVAHVKNAVDRRGRVIQPAVQYLKAREIEECKTELQQIDNMLSPQNIARQSMTSDGRATLARRRVSLEDKLEAQAAPNLTPQAKDALAKRLGDLEEKIRVGMPTHEEMRRNPAGAVDKHRRWERLNKDAVLERRNILIALNPGDDSKDLTNIDLIRPSSVAPGAATFMPDAQIPGHFAMTPAAKANWPLGEPKLDTPLNQAERAEAVEAKPAKREWTAEQKEAARQRGLNLAKKAAEARAAKAAVKAE